MMLFVLIGITVAAIVGYVWYANNPGTIYKKAQELINNGRFQNASEELISIQDKHPEAITLYARCKLAEAKTNRTKNPKSSFDLLSEGLDLRKTFNGSVTNEISFKAVEKDIVSEIIQLSQQLFIHSQFELAITAILKVKELEPSVIDKYVEYKYYYGLSQRVLNPVKSIQLFKDVLVANSLFTKSLDSRCNTSFASKSGMELYDIANEVYLAKNYSNAEMLLKNIFELDKRAINLYFSCSYEKGLDSIKTDLKTAISIFYFILDSTDLRKSASDQDALKVVIESTYNELYNAGLVYLEKSEFEKADPILERLLPFHAFAASLMAKSKYLQAEGQITQKNFIECHNKLKEVLSLKNRLTSISNKESFVLIEQDAYNKLYDLALIYIQSKKFVDAAEILNGLLDINPLAVTKLAESRLLQGDMLKNSDLDKACKFYELSLDSRKLLCNISDIQSFEIIEARIFDALYESACIYIMRKKYTAGNLILTTFCSKLKLTVNKLVESFYMEALDHIKSDPRKSLHLLDEAIRLIADNSSNFSLNEVTVINQITEAQIAVSESFVLKGYYDEALTVTKKLFDKHPESISKYIEFKIQLARSMINKDTDQSMLILDDALTAETFLNELTNKKSLYVAIKNIYSAQIDVAQIYLSRNEFNSARQILLKIEKLHKLAIPKIAESHLLEGMFLRSKPEEAEICLKKGLSAIKGAPKVSDKKELQKNELKITDEFIEVAKQYAFQQKFSNAYNLLSPLFTIHKDAISYYAEFKYKEACFVENKDQDKAIELLLESVQCQKLLTKVSDTDSYLLVLERSRLKIAQVRHDKYFPSLKTLDLDSQIEIVTSNLKFIEDTQIILLKDKANELKALIYDILKQLYYKSGAYSEQKGKFSEAKTSYTNSIKYCTNKDEHYYYAFIRNQICNLKKGKKLTKTVVEEIAKTINPFKIDFIYRYVIFLLKDDKFEEAEKYISLFLDEKQEAVIKLKKICNKKRIESTKREIDEFNDKIIAITNDSMSLNESETIYNSIEKIANDFSIFFPEVKTLVLDLKPILFNNIIGLYFNENKYEDVIRLIILQYPKFYESPFLLKNIGIACIRLAEAKLFTEINYKDIVSLWLTCIYADKLIISSLEYTSWDDEFTFTLNGAIGSNYQFHTDLPENVNYDEPSTSNISIGEVQKELLKEFQIHIDNISKDSLRNKVQSFYGYEKKSIEKCIEIIPEYTVFCTPHFAQKYHMNVLISKKLVADFEQYGNEEALDVGQYYDIKKEFEQINNFTLATLCFENLFRSIKCIDISGLKASLTKPKIDLILSFERIGSDLETKLFVAIKDQISVDSLNENLIPIMEYIIDMCPTFSNIKHQYCGFVNVLCVTKVNADNMTNEKALKYTNSAHTLVSNNQQLLENLYSLVTRVMVDVFDNNIRGKVVLKNVLTRLKSDTGFEQKMIQNFDLLQNQDPLSANLISMLDEVISLKPFNSLKEKRVDFSLSKVIVRVNTGVITNTNALREIRDLYNTNNSNNHLCEVLVTVIHACLMEFINDKSATSTIFNIIDPIISNRSYAFRNKADKLKIARRDILNQLPADAREQIVYGLNLNPTGLKLKKAVDYLEKLSN